MKSPVSQRRVRILFVGMPSSIHAARWIEQLGGLGWDLHFFPCFLERAHHELRHVTLYGLPMKRPADLHPSVRWRGVWPLPRGAARIQPSVQKRLPNLLAGLISALKPDLVHSLESQHAGYLTLKARQRLASFPPWILQNYGSDIFLFGRLPDHARRVHALLASVDFYHAECERDVGLARAAGFAGEVLGVLPNAGGLHLERLETLRSPGPVSARRTIAVKGYQGWVGRALVALRALELNAEALQDYRIRVFGATSPEIGIAAELLAGSTGLDVEVLPPCSHDEVLRLHGRARTSIALGISDGIPQGAIEAMAMGSFPIQSNTSCLGDWVEDGQTGILVHPEDPMAVADAVRRVVSDGELVDRAAEANAAVIAERASRERVRAQAIDLYRRALSNGRAR